VDFFDLQKGDPLVLVADVMALYSDFNGLKANCPGTATAYKKFFSKLVAAFKTDPTTTLLAIMGNIIGSFADIQSDLLKATQDFGAKNYYAAGQDIGTVVQLALKGFI